MKKIHLFIFALFFFTPLLSYADTATTTATSTPNQPPELAWFFSGDKCEADCVIEFYENSDHSFPIAQVVVTNNNENQSHKFEIVSGNPHKTGNTSATAFGIDQLGYVYIRTPILLDYEKYHSFTLRVKVTENGSPKKDTAKSLQINLIDIPNDRGSGFGNYPNTATSTPVGSYGYATTTGYRSFGYGTTSTSSVYGSYIGNYVVMSTSSFSYSNGTSTKDNPSKYYVNYRQEGSYVSYDNQIQTDYDNYNNLPSGYIRQSTSKYPSYDSSIKNTVAYGTNPSGYVKTADGAYFLYTNGGSASAQQYVQGKYPGYIPQPSTSYIAYGDTGNTVAVGGNFGATEGVFNMGSGFTFTKTLYFGVSDTEVKALQTVLNQIGFAIATTGNGSRGKETTYFGRATEGAVKRFQASVGVSQTGTVGPKTREKLNAILGAK